MTKWRPNQNQSSDKEFIRIPKGFIGGPLWKLMTHAEHTVYCELRAKWQAQTHGNYERGFVLPYDRSTSAPASFSKAVKKLRRFRVLVIDEHGGLYKNASVYRFVRDDWCKYELTDKEKCEIGAIDSRMEKLQKKNEQRLFDKTRHVRESGTSQLHPVKV